MHRPIPISLAYTVLFNLLTAPTLTPHLSIRASTWGMLGMDLQHFRKVSFWPRIRASAHPPKNTYSGLSKNYRKLRLYEDIIGKTLTSHHRICAFTQGELGRDFIFSGFRLYSTMLLKTTDFSRLCLRICASGCSDTTLEWPCIL